ncbi:hypothetical protein HDU67_002571, partial [Dinochytrium kinnereticum]
MKLKAFKGKDPEGHLDTVSAACVKLGKKTDAEKLEVLQKTLEKGAVIYPYKEW